MLGAALYKKQCLERREIKAMLGEALNKKLCLELRWTKT